MTFWTDAKPATPRFRLRRRHRPGGGRRPGRAVAVALVIGVDGGRRRRRRGAGGWRARVHGRRHARTRRTRHASAAGRPGQLVGDVAGLPAVDAGRPGRGVIVIGSDWGEPGRRSTTGTRTGARTTPRLNDDAASRGDTILVSTKAGFVVLDRTRAGAVAYRHARDPGAVALVGPAGTPAVAMVSTQEGGLVGLDSPHRKARWSVRFPGYIGGVPAPDDALRPRGHGLARG